MSRKRLLAPNVSPWDLIRAHQAMPFDRIHQPDDLIEAKAFIANARYADAIYLAMANRLHCPVMSGDGNMVEAARICGCRMYRHPQRRELTCGDSVTQQAGRRSKTTSVGSTVLDEFMDLPVMPPVPPMLAKSATNVPTGDVSYEPKWDGFRSIIFRDGDEVEIGSRNERPMTRYFPELVDAVRTHLPPRCVVDGEVIVIAADGIRLDFDALQQRIHPADSRVRMLAEATPAHFVAFDLLALGDENLMDRPFVERRAVLVEALGTSGPPIHLTPATVDKTLAEQWFQQFEGAGLDGLVVKSRTGTYQPDKRTMIKVKHERTADCVVAGYRVHKSGPDRIGSLLLGLYDSAGDLVSVGVIGAFPMARRQELFEELQPLVTDFDEHPWAWAKQETGTRTPRNAEGSRWSAGKDLSFVPLRPERVVEVRYDHMEGVRFRHTAQFVRWRDDRDPESCTFDQLEEPVSFDLADVLSVGRADA